MVDIFRGSSVAFVIEDPCVELIDSCLNKWSAVIVMGIELHVIDILSRLTLTTFQIVLP